MKVVLVRLDKIGDLIATLPVDQVSFLSPAQNDVHWIISDGLGFLPSNAEPQRKFLELSLKTPENSFWKLFDYLKKEKPDAAVMFYGPWWAAFAMWLARVPIRGGRKSQWYSFLFFNRGLRQSRSQALMHEADYNREVLEAAFRKPAEATPILKLTPPMSRHLMEKHNLRSKDYVVIHPGMAGSALNWPQGRYNELIAELVLKTTVVITGTPGDDIWLSQIRPIWKDHAKVRWLQGLLTLPELLQILNQAKAVVAPSTGVLHMAAACGTPVVGIYSPIVVHSIPRWGPRGISAFAIAPKNADENCMESISASEVLQKLEL